MSTRVRLASTTVVLAFVALLCVGAAVASARSLGNAGALRQGLGAADPLPPIDLSEAENCDFIADPGNELCMLPFPDDYYTVARPDQPHRPPRRTSRPQGCRPTSSASTSKRPPTTPPTASAPARRSSLKVPGIETAADVAATGAVPINHLGRYTEAERAGRRDRRPDRQALADLDRDRLDRRRTRRRPCSRSTRRSTSPPATATSSPCAASERGRRSTRSARPPSATTATTCPRSSRRSTPARPHFEATLLDASQQPGSSAATSTWPGTSPSPATRTTAGRELAMRNDAFAQLGDTNLADGIPQGVSPSFQVTERRKRTRTRGRSRAASRARFEVPCYLFPTCEPGGTMQLDAERQHRSRTAPGRPTSTASSRESVTTGPAGSGAPVALRARAASATPARSARARSASLSQAHEIVQCATDEIGMSESDVADRDRGAGERLRLPDDPRPPAAGPARRALPRAGADQPERLHDRRRPSTRTARCSAARCSTPATSTTTATARAGSWAAP